MPGPRPICAVCAALPCGVPVPLRAYLFADPAAHSLSPAMHAAAFAAAGLDGTYQAVRVPPDGLAAKLRALSASGALGANLSLPHKEAAVGLVGSLSGAARRIGALNTLVVRGGALYGDNTDASGLLAALGDAQAPPGPAAVLGAGGAARAAVYALAQGGRQVWIWNRTPQRAGRLAAEFGARAASFTELPWMSLRLLINATSAGLNAPDELPLPAFPELSPEALVYDMVYRPLETRLLREARGRGYRAENGLGMLAHQARLSFALWTGADVGAEVFLSAARQAVN